MLRNSSKMVVISSNSNEWTNKIDEHNMGSIVVAQTPSVMDPKVSTTTFSQEQQKLQQNNNNSNTQVVVEPLRCPRCDSSNTKFCYYNNYSLSQPRHFCKACKRYWTRGGTLRSVPVGGGCRKNKRVKRSSNNNHSSSTNITSNNNTNLKEGGHIHDIISSNSNPLLYGLPTNNHSLMNFPFSRYDLENSPQINGLGLGFSSGLVNDINGGGNNFINPHNNKQFFQDLISSNDYANTSSSPSTISSLLASTFQMKGGSNNFGTIMPSYEDTNNNLHMKESGERGMFITTKGVKMEVEGQNRSFDHHQMDHNMGSSSCDPSIIWGSGPNLGAWLDPSNNNHLGSSIPL